MAEAVPEAVRLGEETSFEIFGRKMTARQWGSADGEPTLCVHGWLDNASSFDVLAPQLLELNIVAVDLCGHGHSDHRPAGMHYINYYDVLDLLAVADALGWSSFNLIGHSMGAEISVELTGMFPERVRKLVMIDGLMATGGATDEERLERNRQAIREALSEQHRQPKVFPDVAAMATRVSEATGQSLESAELLVRRGHKRVAGGVTWRTDPRIRSATPLRPTRAQIDLLLAACEVPTLLMVAAGGDRWFADELTNAQERHPMLTLERLAGPHHLHMEAPYADAVLAHTRSFFGLDA
jgi:pimeloyl-ACP methyl ester carboxylesterase